MVEILDGGSGDPPPAPPEPSLRDRLFPSRGFSAVEALCLVNVLVGAVLVAVWKGAYGRELVTAMRDWHEAVQAPWDVWRMTPTLFIHAGFGHLARNMLGLVAAGGAVEIFYGSRRTIAIYFLTGMTGAVFSYFGHMRPPLSVGASGAVFGLAGVTAAFLVRYYPRFTERQKWKTRRVYGPLFLLLVAPSLLQADYHAHVGGFLAGILLGLLLPLDDEGRKHLHPPDHAPDLQLVELDPEGGGAEAGMHPGAPRPAGSDPGQTSEGEQRRPPEDPET